MQFTLYGNGSQPGATPPPRGHLAMFGDIFACHKWRDATDLQRVQAWDANKYPIRHRTAPQIKELSDSNVNCVSVEKPCYRVTGKERKKQEKKTVFKFSLPDYQHMFLDLKAGRKKPGRKLPTLLYKMADVLQICKYLGKLGRWRQKVL